MVELDVNCIGYAIHQLGLTPQEKFIPPLSYDEILQEFDEIDGRQTAEVVGVVRPGGNDFHTGPTVCHMAILEPNGMIGHRRDYDNEVTHELFEDGLAEFLMRPDYFKIIYLICKNTK